jgi:hypothetical protein
MEILYTSKYFMSREPESQPGNKDPGKPELFPALSQTCWEHDQDS